MTEDEAWALWNILQKLQYGSDELIFSMSTVPHSSFSIELIEKAVLETNAKYLK
jgi:hypothetical protein